VEEAVDVRMNKVEITLTRWQEIFQGCVWDGDGLEYRMSNGLVISSENIIMPWEWAGSNVLVAFEEEKDAAWFILSYGGEMDP